MLPGRHVPARLVLYMLSWSGFLVSFMMRTDINLAIVAMVESPTVPDEGNGSFVEEMYCYDIEQAQNTTEQLVSTLKVA